MYRIKYGKKKAGTFLRTLVFVLFFVMGGVAALLAERMNVVEAEGGEKKDEAVYAEQTLDREVTKEESPEAVDEGKEELSIGYDANVPFDEDPETIEKSFQEKMEAARDTDLLRGITSCGPHRDDLKVTINGIDVRRYGSQGQQRTAAIAIKLAEIQLMEEESGEKPVLILDDALSELDKSRQRYLIEALTGTQIFLTAASVSRGILEHFPDKKIFEISDGKILPYHE